MRFSFQPSLNRCPAELGRVETFFPKVNSNGSVVYVCGFSGCDIKDYSNCCKNCISRERYKGVDSK